MTRSWEPGDAPEELKDWVSSNVEQALEEFISDGDYFLHFENGQLELEFALCEVEGKKCNVRDLILEWATLDYKVSAQLHGLSLAQKEDLEERAAFIDGLAAEFRKKIAEQTQNCGTSHSPKPDAVS